jgi:hypothetical protein
MGDGLQLALDSADYLRRQEMAKFDTGKMAGADTGRGYNQTLASGHPFWSLVPSDDDVHIEDIASHLSRLCRFNGALKDSVEIYTVAQHSCLVSDHLPPELQLEGLLHDAQEYVLGDMAKPIKMNLATLSGGRDYWKELEHGVEAVIRAKFGLPAQMTPEVKHQDYLAVAAEHRDLQNNLGLVDWGTPPQTWPELIIPWSISRSRGEFMTRYRRLTRG